MQLSDLKNNILNNTLDNSLLIFIWKDTNFLVNQYIHEMARIKGQTIQYVDSFLELIDLSTNDNVFGEEFSEKVLKVLVLDTFNEPAKEGMTKIENSIIVCHEITKEALSTYDDYPNMIVQFPKVEDWQVKDYMKVSCGGLSNDSINKLYEVTNGDVYRIDNELNKIKCFPKEQQEDIFKRLMLSGAYSDLSQMSIFNLVNAIIKRDMTLIGDALRNIKNIDIDAIGLTTLLHKNIKNIIDIQMNKEATPESLNMSDKQFKAIKYYNCGRISNEALRGMLVFLDEIDFKLKSGGLDISNEDKIDYIVLKMLEN